MTRILSLLQIQTLRSAWVFLAGSGLLFFFGVYQALDIYQYPHFEITFFAFWFLVTGIYMVVTSWVLFSEKGRMYLKAQEQIQIKGNRGLLWLIKFIFACYAAAIATIMLLGIMALPIAGYAGFDIMLSPNRGMYLLFAGLIWSPLFFRYLK